MKKLRLILILFIACSTFISAQYSDLVNQQRYAASLFESGEYESSLKEYLRLYYYDTQNQYPATCHHIAVNFMMLNDAENALKYLDLYYFKLKNEAEKNQIRYEKQRIYLSKGEYNKALVEILQVNKKTDQFDMDKYHFMLACNYLFADNYSKSRELLSKLSYFQKIDTIQLTKKYKSLAKNFKKNPKNARWYSAAFPGLGQAINGDVSDGLNSLGLYVGFWALFFDLSTDIGIPDSALSVGPWLLRYYIGGLQNAVKIAKQRKLDKKSQCIGEIVQLINVAKNNL